MAKKTYKVRIILHEEYVTYVEAKNEERAEALAIMQLEQGDLDASVDTMQVIAEEDDA